MKNDTNAIILDALRKKLGDKKLQCPISGGDVEWEVQRRVSSMPALDSPNQSPLDATTGFPLAVLTCSDCGFTFFVNLVTLGVATDLNLPVFADE